MKTSKHYVYRNLHTKTFSLQYKQRVIAHPTEIVLQDVVFKVSENGRQRVISEKRKNVHAKVGGTPISVFPSILEDFYTKVEVYYSPYKTEFFTRLDNNEPVHRAEYALCKNNKIFILE